jgi:hypothetical protein
MAQANDAYSLGDAEALQRILDDYDESSESVQGEGVGAELVRIIRQIHQAKKNIATIEQELVILLRCEIAVLRQDVETAQQQGRDLLAELAETLRKKIVIALEEYETLIDEVSRRDRRV